MSKETFRIDIDRRMMDEKVVKTTYSIERCGCVNFVYMTLDEVQLLITCLQNAINEEKGRDNHE